MAGWFLFVKMKHNVDTCHIFVTQKESWIIDTCHQCNVVHFIIILYLLGLGTQNMGSKEMYFQNFDYENCFLERKKPVKISVKGDKFFRWKNNLPSFHRILYICVLDPSLPILCIVYHRTEITLYIIIYSFLCSFFLKNCLHNP